MRHLEDVRGLSAAARASRKQHLEDIDARNARIRQARADGVSRAALAEASGMSPEHIGRICGEQQE